MTGTIQEKCRTTWSSWYFISIMQLHNYLNSDINFWQAYISTADPIVGTFLAFRHLISSCLFLFGTLSIWYFVRSILSPFDIFSLHHFALRHFALRDFALRHFALRHFALRHFALRQSVCERLFYSANVNLLDPCAYFLYFFWSSTEPCQ